MTWRDEPMTKGDFVDALTTALALNKKGSEGLLESYKEMAKNSPALYQTLRLIFKTDETTLETMRDHIMAEGAIQDALSNSDAPERPGDSEAAGSG